MATRPLSPAETHQEAQEGVAGLIVDLLARLWALFNPQQPSVSVPLFREGVGAVVNSYGLAAAGVAQDYYARARLDAGIPGRPPAVVVPEVPEGFIDELVAEALAEAEADMARATAFLDSGAQQLVQEQARRQLMSTARLDKEARGWTRVPNADACSFCLMLALRGPVYNSKRGASFKAHVKKPNGSGGDCKCSVEPVFGPWEPTARVRAAQRLWDESTVDENGRKRTGKDARDAFRQAVEGREVTGSRDKRTTNRRGEKHEPAQGKTPENQRAQLRILEALPPAKTPEAAQWRRDRIAEIRKYLGE